MTCINPIQSTITRSIRVWSITTIPSHVLRPQFEMALPLMSPPFIKKKENVHAARQVVCFQRIEISMNLRLKFRWNVLFSTNWTYVISAQTLSHLYGCQSCMCLYMYVIAPKTPHIVQANFLATYHEEPPSTWNHYAHSNVGLSCEFDHLLYFSNDVTNFLSLWTTLFDHHRTLRKHLDAYRLSSHVRGKTFAH